MTKYLLLFTLLGFSWQALGESDELQKIASLPRVKRAIGGRDVAEGEWPHLIHLRGKIPSRTWWGIPVAYKNYYCGGVIINRRWIATAAHCFSATDAPPKINLAKHWHIKAGETDRSHDVFDKFKHYAGSIFGRSDWLLWYVHAEKIIKHPNFDSAQNWINDIALIKVEKDLPVDDSDENIATIDLNGDDNWPAINEPCFFAGWGCNTNGGPLLETAQVVKLPIKDSSVCDGYFGAIGDTRICAGENLGGKGICRGDSGGPLTCVGNDNKWYAVGLASFTSATNPGNVPGVFTRLSQYKQWIEATIAAN